MDMAGQLMHDVTELDGSYALRLHCNVQGMHTHFVSSWRVLAMRSVLAITTLLGVSGALHFRFGVSQMSTCTQYESSTHVECHGCSIHVHECS